MNFDWIICYRSNFMEFGRNIIIDISWLKTEANVNRSISFLIKDWTFLYFIFKTIRFNYLLMIEIGWWTISHDWNIWCNETFRSNTRNWYSMHCSWMGLHFKGDIANDSPFDVFKRFLFLLSTIFPSKLNMFVIRKAKKYPTNCWELALRWLISISVTVPIRLKVLWNQACSVLDEYVKVGA